MTKPKRRNQFTKQTATQNQKAAVRKNIDKQTKLNYRKKDKTRILERENINVQTKLLTRKENKM